MLREVCVACTISIVFTLPEQNSDSAAGPSEEEGQNLLQKRQESFTKLQQESDYPKFKVNI